MAADREKDESLLPPDYVSLVQLQKKWLQAQEEKKMKLKQEEENRDKIALAPIGDPRQSGSGNDRKEETPAGRRGNLPRVGLMVLKDKGEVKAGDEVGKGVDITARENRKTRSEQKAQRSKLVEKGDEVHGNGEKGVLRKSTDEKKGTVESVVDVLRMKAENGRIAAANRGGNERRGRIRDSRQEYRVNVDESVSQETMENEHGGRRGNGGKPRNGKPKKGIRAVNLEVKEVDTEVKLDESDGKPRNRKPKKGIRAANLEVKEVDTEVKLDESESKKIGVNSSSEVKSEHGGKRGNGGKPRNGKPKKGIRAVNLEVKEVDTEVKLDESDGKPRNRKPKKGIRAVNLEVKEVDTEVKLDESESKKIGVNSSSEVQSEHGGKKGNGGKRQKRKPKKGSKAVNLEVKEVDTEMGDEVVAVCNAIYCLTTSDENGISEPKGYQVKRTEGSNAGVKCLAGENVALQKDRPVEIKGVTDKKGRDGSGRFFTFTAGNVDKDPELMNENYHEKLRVRNGRNRYRDPKGNMRSRWDAHASLGRFDLGSRKEGNSRLVWMKKGEKSIAADEGSSGFLADQD